MSTIAKTSVRTYQNYVSGQWVSSASGETFPVYDPSTEEVIAQFPSACAADVDHAAKAARAAFDSGPWATTTAQDRSQPRRGLPSRHCRCRRRLRKGPGRSLLRSKDRRRER